jgi:hypothetical protein
VCSLAVGTLPNATARLVSEDFLARPSGVVPLGDGQRVSKCAIRHSLLVPGRETLLR